MLIFHDRKKVYVQIIDTFAFINVFIVDVKQFEKISKALADTTRLQILCDMAKRNGCIQCSEIMTITKLAQPSVSHHVKTLIESGLINAEKDGRNHSYNLNRNLLEAYSSWIGEMAAE